MKNWTWEDSWQAFTMLVGGSIFALLVLWMLHDSRSRGVYLTDELNDTMCVKYERPWAGDEAIYCGDKATVISFYNQLKADFLPPPPAFVIQ